MKRLLRLIALAGFSLTISFTVESADREFDPRLINALRQAAVHPSSFNDDLDALVWLAGMSERLKQRIPDPFYRVSLLKTVHAEASRAGLEPELVLALIDVESGFDRYAVSPSGARGLMQVMPFWKKEIGHPNDNLFYPRTNLRYGCAILRYYLEVTKGDVAEALAKYNGSATRWHYTERVLFTLRNRWQPLLAKR